MATDPTTPQAAAVNDARLAAEERWVYERWVEGYRLDEIADRAALPVHEGGLARRMSLNTISRRRRAYSDALAADNDVAREEHRQAELDRLNKQERLLKTMLEPIDRAATYPMALALGITVDELIATRPRFIVMREDGVKLAALREMRAVGAERRKLLGLDAPIETHVTVTNATDQALAELERQLEQNDAPERQDHDQRDTTASA